MKTPNTQADVILTIDDVCAVYKLKKSGVRQLIFKKQIPCFRIGRLIRFSKKRLDLWVMEKMRTSEVERIMSKNENIGFD